MGSFYIELAQTFCCGELAQDLMSAVTVVATRDNLQEVCLQSNKVIKIHITSCSQ